MRCAAFLLLLPLCAQPRVYLNSDDLARIQATAAAEPWARAELDRLLQRARQWPAPHLKQFGLKEWALPTEGSGWSHAYVCPEHGVRLRQTGAQNLCPVDGKDYHGWPVDNVVYMMRHGDNARDARDLALAWRLTGDAALAANARRILNAYSPLYRTLPIHDNNNRLEAPSGARVMSQTLSEAGWLVPLVFAYDLVRDSMSASERAAFEDGVLREAARVVSKYDMKKSNWQSWHNAALLAIGLTLDDQPMVEAALDGPSGFRFQMRESITPDGPWFEGAWGYHFFSVEPLLVTYEMARRARITLPEAAALARMLDAPERAVFPDGTLPNFNDSARVPLPPRRKPFERLLWGDSPFPARPATQGSDLMPDAGLATLRVAGSDHTLAVKFGPHGGGHGHNDKLTFVSFANGRHLATDAGTQAYAAPTHATWDKTTVAHNTIVVDETSHAPSTGRLLAWQPTPTATLLKVAAGPVYEGIELVRTFVHTAAYTLDIFEARSPQAQENDARPRRIDWIYHNEGSLEVPFLLQPDPELPRANGYQHLTPKGWALQPGSWHVDFTGLRLHMLSGGDTRLIVGNALGPDLRVPVPFVLARRTAPGSTFTALYEPFTTKPSIRAFRRTAPGVYEIEFDNRTDVVTLEPFSVRQGH